MELNSNDLHIPDTCYVDLVLYKGRYSNGFKQVEEVSYSRLATGVR